MTKLEAAAQGPAAQHHQLKKTIISEELSRRHRVHEEHGVLCL